MITELPPMPFNALSPAHKVLAHLMRDNYNDIRLISNVGYKKSRVAFEGEVISPLVKAGAIKPYMNNIYSITNVGVDIYMRLQDVSAVYIGIEIPKTAAKRKTDVMTKQIYDGAELKPYTGRPGANDSLKLPSRMGDTLVYRKDA